MIPVKQSSNGMYGFISHASPTWKIPPVFRFASNFHGGYAVVADHKSDVLIDINGEVVLRFDTGHEAVGFVAGDNLVADYCPVIDRTQGLGWVLDRDLRMREIPGKVSDINSFGDFLVVKRTTFYEIWHLESLTEIFALRIAQFCASRTGYWCIKFIPEGPLWYYLDPTTGRVFESGFPEASSFDQGFATVFRDGCWKIINSTFDDCYSCDSFDFVGQFAMGYADAITKQGILGLISPSGVFQEFSNYSSLESVNRMSLTIGRRCHCEDGGCVDVLQTTGKLVTGCFVTAEFVDCDTPYFFCQKESQRVYLSGEGIEMFSLLNI
jgi:hypothetical protein